MNAYRYAVDYDLTGHRIRVPKLRRYGKHYPKAYFDRERVDNLRRYYGEIRADLGYANTIGLPI